MAEQKKQAEALFAEIKPANRAVKMSAVAFVLVFVLGISMFAGLNFYADPYGYFAKENGQVVLDSYDTNYKLQHVSVLKNLPSDTFQGLIVGGSKSAVLSTGLLRHYTGKNYYMTNITYGNFDFYEQIITYALSHQQIKHVVLHLSGLEVYVEEPVEEDRHTPVELTGGSKYEDDFHYMFLGVNEAVETLTTGNRNAGSEFESDKALQIGKDPNEELDRIISYAGRGKYHRMTMAEDPATYEKWAEQYVLDYYGDYGWTLGQLFEYYSPNLINKDSNIQTLQRIKNICDAYGAELTVIMGSTFLGELYRYESAEYWDYIYEMVQITDVWDFSYYCDYNMNPYNFFNAAHNLETTAWQMVMNMYGERVNDYGQLLTKENVVEKLQERMESYYRLQKEWMETGTIELKGYDDPSNISKLPDWVMEMDLSYGGM